VVDLFHATAWLWEDTAWGAGVRLLSFKDFLTKKRNAWRASLDDLCLDPRPRPSVLLPNLT
jgi:hypothetical protein